MPPLSPSSSPAPSVLPPASPAPGTTAGLDDLACPSAPTGQPAEPLGAGAARGVDAGPGTPVAAGVRRRLMVRPSKACGVASPACGAGPGGVPQAGRPGWTGRGLAFAAGSVFDAGSAYAAGPGTASAAPARTATDRARAVWRMGRA